ncbi:FAD-binding protein [Amycolatopsis ruanii]|uniref:FAD-binding protein n=1 Tax=Amycolatopsis ruanii TaxID=944491 RepID=UPI000E270FAF|nr:FAD-binding protein [Amycolatopsis ruanii]
MTHTAIGWDPGGREWTTRPSGAAVPAPPLAGDLLVVAAAREAASRDLGRLVTRRPSAVLRPAEVDDIAKMVRLCHDHAIPVAAQGTRHQTNGQALAPDGLVIDMTSLNTIHRADGDRADSDAGVLWSDLAATLAGSGLRFAGGLTGYVPLSVGGTLSAGGISPNFEAGAQIDFVERIQVVTGRGEVVWASEAENRKLFAAALGGLGQAGIITRAELVVAPMPAWVHSWVLPHPGIDGAFAAMRALISGGLATEVYCMIVPPGPTFLVHAAWYEYADGAPPPDVPGRLGWAGPVQHEVSGYLDHVLKYSAIIDQWRQAGWDERRKPWFDVFLPGSRVREFVGATLDRMTPLDWSAPHGEGFVLLFPHRASAFRRPRLRLPRPEPDGLVWLFDVLNAAEHDADAGYAEAMLVRNREWIADATAAGGVVYPIGTHGFTAADWQRHYGDDWEDVVRAKRLFDPALILAPGQGITAAVR